RPTLFAHKPMHDRERDRVVKSPERAKNQGSMRPGARKRDIEVVASRFGLETALPGRTGASVQSDPLSEPAFLTDKAASGDASVVPAIGPFPVNKKAHARTLFSVLILDHSNRMGRERRRTGMAKPSERLLEHPRMG